MIAATSSSLVSRSLARACIRDRAAIRSRRSRDQNRLRRALALKGLCADIWTHFGHISHS
jgi:hypothetical protein